ncbi:MAG: TraR/DksA C4-type zinc finger protein [Saprospiraceae bacterium]
MPTQKNTKSSKATATKGKPSKAAAVKKPTPKAPAKGKKPVKPVVASKAKAPAKTVIASKAKKATPAAKKPVSKPAQKPIAKKAAPVKASQVKSKTTKPLPKAHVKSVAPKTATKPVVTARTKVLTSVKPAAPKAAATVTIPKVSSPVMKPTPIAKPVVAVKLPVKVTPKPVVHEAPKVITKSVPVHPIVNEHKPIVSPDKPVVSAVKPEAKNTGSKSSDLVKPSVSSKPLEEKPKEQAQPPKEFQRKSLKQSTAHAVKSHETMSDKKENKTMGVAFPDEPQKSRYNDKELEEFDQLIDQKLIVAREQLEFYLKQLEDMAENPDNKIKGLDDGLSTLESERVSSMASRQQKLIQHLENAKIRIKNKVYGICRETGKLISKERLRAVPHATLSIEAKQAQN